MTEHNENIDLEGVANEEVVNEGEENQEVIEEAADTEVVKYTLDDGSEASRSEYIRQEFEKNRSRQDIAKELDVKYHSVYSATANMYNSHHPEGGTAGGRGVAVAAVNSEFKYINAEGEVVETEEEAAVVQRADLMRELFGAGATRGAIKDHFAVPYATVYAATKDVEAPEGTVRGGRKEIEHPETGEMVSRADYIRELYADGEGMTRKDIAKLLTDMTDELVDYAVVWTATKPKKEVVEGEEDTEEADIDVPEDADAEVADVEEAEEADEEEVQE